MKSRSMGADGSGAFAAGAGAAAGAATAGFAAAALTGTAGAAAGTAAGLGAEDTGLAAAAPLGLGDGALGFAAGDAAARALAQLARLGASLASFTSLAGAAAVAASRPASLGACCGTTSFAAPSFAGAPASRAEWSFAGCGRAVGASAADLLTVRCLAAAASLVAAALRDAVLAIG